MPKRDVWQKSQKKLEDDSINEGRYLHFIRHGQYVTGPGHLTALGQRQAVHLARHLAKFELESVTSSDWIRAKQTAHIVARELRLTPPHHRRVLREVLPTPVKGMRIPIAKRAEGKRRIELVLARFFKPARVTRHEAIVCHGNLIRSLMLRVSAGRTIRGWERFAIHHASITTFLVTKSGIRILGYNAVSHLPKRLRTEV